MSVFVVTMVGVSVLVAVVVVPVGAVTLEPSQDHYNDKVLVKESYLTVAIATVVVIVVVVTVEETVTARAVSAQVLRGTGNFCVQNVSAGAYPLSAEAATAVRPLQLVVAGQDATARLFVIRLPRTIKLDKSCMSE